MTGVRRIGVVAATLTLCAACGGGGTHHQAAPPSASTTADAPTTGATTALPATTNTTLDPTKAAILAAYRASSQAYYAAATRYPVDPTDPRLPTYMTGQELARARNSLTILAHLGRVLRGPPVDTSMATIKQLLGTAAVVADCDFDQTATIDSKTGQVVTAAPTERTLINAELDLLDGAWKVSRFNIVSHGCTASV